MYNGLVSSDLCIVSYPYDCGSIEKKGFECQRYFEIFPFGSMKHKIFIAVTESDIAVTQCGNGRLQFLCKGWYKCFCREDDFGMCQVMVYEKSIDTLLAFCRITVG